MGNTSETSTPAPFVVGRGLPKAFYLSMTTLSAVLFLFGFGVTGWRILFEAGANVLVPFGFGMVGALWTAANYLSFWDKGTPPAEPSKVEDSAGANQR